MPAFVRAKDPRLVPVWGRVGVPQTPFLFAPQRPQRAGDANCGRNCFGRLMLGETVRLFRNENERRLNLAFQCPQRAQLISEQSES